MPQGGKFGGGFRCTPSSACVAARVDGAGGGPEGGCGSTPGGGGAAPPVDAAAAGGGGGSASARSAQGGGGEPLERKDGLSETLPAVELPISVAGGDGGVQVLGGGALLAGARPTPPPWSAAWIGETLGGGGRAAAVCPLPSPGGGGRGGSAPGAFGSASAWIGETPGGGGGAAAVCPLPSTGGRGGSAPGAFGARLTTAACRAGAAAACPGSSPTLHHSPGVRKSGAPMCHASSRSL